jgi:hypothetical protein
LAILAAIRRASSLLSNLALITDKARPPKTALLVESAALVSPRVVRNSDFDARVVVRQCRRASHHHTCNGIAGSRGVQLSSMTEQDDGEWLAFPMGAEIVDRAIPRNLG